MNDAATTAPPTESVRRFRRGILAFHRRSGRTFPWRNTRDPYAVLIGEVLLQRTRAERVESAYLEFLRRWPGPAALAAADPHELALVLRPLGLVKRTRLVAQLGRALGRLDKISLRPERLVELPGVGPYVAHAVPVLAEHRNLPLVDWVIARVLRRYFGLTGSRRPNHDPELWDLAGRLVRSGRAREIWLGTLDLAAAVCKPKPRCGECPLGLTCEYATRENAGSGRG